MSNNGSNSGIRSTVNTASASASAAPAAAAKAGAPQTVQMNGRTYRINGIIHGSTNDFADAEYEYNGRWYPLRNAQMQIDLARQVAGVTAPSAQDWTRGRVDQTALSNFVRTITGTTSGISAHTTDQNDRAQARIEANIAREMAIARAYNTYLSTARITGPDDPWWVGHQEALGTLKAQLRAFKAERKRTGR